MNPFRPEGTRLPGIFMPFYGLSEKYQNCGREKHGPGICNYGTMAKALSHSADSHGTPLI